MSATEFAVLGANVIAASRNEEKLKAAVGQLDTSSQQHAYPLLWIFWTGRKKFDLEFLLIIIIHSHKQCRRSACRANDWERLMLQKWKKLHPCYKQSSACSTGCSRNETAGFGRIITVSTSVKQPINGLGISNPRVWLVNWAKTLANASYGITINNVLFGFTNTDRLNYLFSKQASDQVD